MTSFRMVEELMEILNFLELNEIEKCQLVSDTWNKSVLKTRHRPRRRVQRLEFEYYPVIDFLVFQLTYLDIFQS